MKLAQFSILFIISIFFGFVPNAFAQMPITPTVYCLGACPTLPSDESPTGEPTDPVAPSTTEAPDPTEIIPSPSTVSSQPCPDSANQNEKHFKYKKKDGGGFFEAFFRFLFRLIELLLGGFRIPPPSDPEPHPNPPSTPCVYPTDPVTPTISVIPSVITVPSQGPPIQVPVTQQYMVLGSHPGWARDVYPPGSAFDYTPWTHILDFGVLVTTSGTLALDSLDETAIQASVTGAHTANKKIIAVIGSEGNGTQFAQAAANTTTRAALVQNIITHVKKYGYDGLSIDWEENVNGANYVALIKELRIEVNKQNPKPFFMADILSGLVEPGVAAQVQNEVDVFNIMSYWSDGADELAAYTGAGIPTNKLIMGIGISPDYHDKTVPDVTSKINIMKQKGMRGIEVWAIQEEDLQGGFTDPRLQPLRELVNGN